MNKDILILEKIVNKKVILINEVIADIDPTTLTGRQKGAYDAVNTKEQNYLTTPQIAVVYIIAKHGKNSLPGRYKSLTLQQIADAAGINFSTLVRNGEHMRKYFNDPSYSLNPKDLNFIKQAGNVQAAEITNLAGRAFSENENKVSAAASKNSSAIASKTSFANVPPEKRAQIDANRAAKGEKPIQWPEYTGGVV